MKKLIFALTILAITGCGDTKWTQFDESPNQPIVVTTFGSPSTTTQRINMKTSIFHADLPSGKMTITVDADTATVSGGYTVKNSTGAIVSAGTVTGSPTSLTFKSGNLSCLESMTFSQSNVTADSADITITGTNCSGTSISGTTTAMRRVTATSRIASRVVVNAATLQEIAINAFSADNVNFSGTMTLTNPELSSLATATITGSNTNNANSKPNPLSGVVIQPVTAGGDGIAFDVKNLSGHFISATDSIAMALSSVRITESFPGSGKYVISEILVKVSDNNGSAIINSSGITPAIITQYTPVP